MPPHSWTIKALIDVTAEYFLKKGIDSPRLNAELLLAHILRCPRLDLYLRFDQPLSAEEITAYRAVVRRRAGREPLQYICGFQEFWSLEFRVSPGVLIPRPETECLMEQALAFYKEGTVPGGDAPRVLDLGTGAGVLAVCLAHEIKGARVCASDISRAALDQARGNARRHGVEKRITWVQGDLFAPFGKLENAPFDLILANPPYVAEEDFSGLQPEVRDHEPREALDGGPGGMDIARRIIEEARMFLSPGGRILVELDAEQMDEARETAMSAGAYAHLGVIRDYARLPRIFSAVVEGGDVF